MALHEFAAKLGSQNECERHMWPGWRKNTRRARQELNQLEVKGMPAKEYVLANEYTTVLRLQSMREQARLPMLEAETEKARQKLLVATRDRKALDNLRKRHLQTLRDGTDQGRGAAFGRSGRGRLCTERKLMKIFAPA